MSLSQGMTYEQFWYDNMDILNMYIAKAEFEYKRNENNINTTAWINGKYIYEAVAVCLAHFNGNSTVEYPNEPYELKNRDLLEDATTQAQINYAKMKNIMTSWNSRIKKQGE